MNLTDYFDWPDIPINGYGLEKNASVYGKLVTLGLTKKVDLVSGSLAIIGVCESRNSNNPGAATAPDAIRTFLYGLSNSVLRKPLVDLGNIKKTASPTDTYLALRDVVSYLNEKGIGILLLGGTQELTFPIFQGLAERNSPLNITIIDHKIDMGVDDEDFSSTCYINRMLNESAGRIFSINHLGHQGYLNNNALVTKFEKSQNNLARLGFVRGSMTEVEPFFRDSNLVSFDMGSIRQGDSPGSVAPSPNGFYAEEACQLAKYAGISNRTDCFSMFEYNTIADRDNQSAHLAAQIAWHFIDGFNHRKADFPSESKRMAKRFYVKSPIPNIEMVFIKSLSTSTWWMELQGTPKTNGSPMLVACSHNDYKLASKGDVPDRWLKALKRMT